MKRPFMLPGRLRDGRRRSIAKSVAYRLLTLTADFIIIYLVTRGLAQTIVLAIITNVLSTVLYYGHERVWSKVRWGLVRY